MQENQQNSNFTLRRAMGFRDVVLFLITACVNLQWVATAAAAGPASITFWFLAFATMSIPLGLCVIELSSRYPQEGGIYVWSKRAFGEFGGFMAGWSYWISNLPYFPAVLFFAVGNALFMGGDRWQHLSSSPGFFVTASCLLLAFATVVNLVGLQIGKWLNNAGAYARWLAAFALVGLGVVAWFKFGSATEFSATSLMPDLSFKGLMFWSTIAFALTGLEAASFMGDEIEDAGRTVPRAIFTALPIIVLIYLAGTVAVMVALPVGETSNLQGVMEAINSVGQRLGVPSLSAVVAAIVALSALGSVGAWLGACARLPFVVGIDEFLPKWFARVHPKWKTPFVSLLFLAGVEVVCVFLAQYGTTVAGAYDYLVSMSVISFLIPFLFLFGSMIRLQRDPASPGVRRVPGGRAGAILLACVGLVTVSAAIFFSFVPAEGEADPGLAIRKLVISTLVMLLGGVILYAVGRWRQQRDAWNG